MLLVLMTVIFSIQDVSSTLENFISLHNKLVNVTENLEQNVLCYISSNESNISPTETKSFSLWKSNLTLDDAVKAFMDILTNTDDVDENREKRSTVNCFDLIASVNKLENVLNGTEIAEFDVEAVVDMLTNITAESLSPKICYSQDEVRCSVILL